MNPPPLVRGALAAVCVAAGALALPATGHPFPTMQTVLLPSSPNSGHLTATRRHRFNVALPCANAFTLFEPIGEKLWAEGWNPVFATPADAELHVGSVFTRTQSHHGQSQTAVWQVTGYDRPAGQIEYRVVYPGQRVHHIAIRCRVAGASLTTVDVTYDYTGLSEEGDRYIADMTENKFRAFIGEWDTAIQAYLARGTPATP